MRNTHQIPLTEIVGFATVDTDATARLFAESICSVPRKPYRKYSPKVRR